MAAINNKSEMSSSTTPRILVLGSGVVGLNTAIRLQMDYPQAEITIMADKFDSELVSHFTMDLLVQYTSSFRPLGYRS